MRFPQNVAVLRQGNRGVSAARNAGLDYACAARAEGWAEYICFLDGDDRYESNFLEEAVRFMEGHRGEADFVAVPVFFFGAGSGANILNRKFKRTGVVDIEEEYDAAVFYVGSLLFALEAVRDMRFNEAVGYTEDGEFITRAVLRKKRYGHLLESRFWYRKRAEGDSAADQSEKRAGWYEKIETVYQALIDYARAAGGSVPRYVQNLIAYDLQWYRVREIAGEVRAAVDMGRLRAALAGVLSAIDDEIIMGQGESSFWEKVGLLKLKHGGVALHEDALEAVPYFSAGRVRMPFNPAVVQVAEECGGVAHIAGFYDLPDYGLARVVARCGGREYASETAALHWKRFYYLGEVAHAALQFDLYVPVPEAGGSVEFFYRTGGGRLLPAALEYAPESRLGGTAGAAPGASPAAATDAGADAGADAAAAGAADFIVCDTTIISRTPGLHILSVERLTYPALRYYAGRHGRAYPRSAGARALQNYAELFPELPKRRVWVFMDRKDCAGDNAEHLFRYAAAQADGVEKWFVVERGSPDYGRVARYGQVAAFGSEEHLLLLLLAEKFISSHALCDLLPDGSQAVLQPFLRCAQVFLNHGINKDDASSYSGRYMKNFALFVTAARLEREEVLSDRYGYAEGAVRLTGYPRFDGLKSAPQRQILFMPTWRRHLNSPQDKGYNPGFKDDPFFHAVNAVLTDARLKRLLKASGFTLLFKVHPEMRQQTADFAQSEEARVTEEGYGALLESGAALITDYSSVAFDFASLKKPVVYYQAVPSHFEASYFDYETMGFGEVVRTADELAGAVGKLLRSGCRMEEKYQRRVDGFFAFADRGNCRRVYGEICKLPPAAVQGGGMGAMTDKESGAPPEGGAAWLRLNDESAALTLRNAALSRALAAARQALYAGEEERARLHDENEALRQGQASAQEELARARAESRRLQESPAGPAARQGGGEPGRGLLGRLAGKMQKLRGRA
jgi:CDP-glycerol glycerophosphotransferase (TagB/SpsB family)/glycosyltransferase involved in cell wall biosynthesis